MQRVMLVLFHAMVAPLLCVIHAAPFSDTTAPLHTSEVSHIEMLNGEGEQFSPYVVFSRQEPTTQPAVEDSGAESWHETCDSESLWVANKNSAVDIRGHSVRVLSGVQTSGLMVKQYFFETRCRPASPTARSCRGVDQRYWNSTCETTRTFVKAITMDVDDVVTWRWIQIDTACVCTLIRRTDQI
ncbi:hypothetical protein lerEdw1_006503 [Lerista edwardsae]|nr:hypothetical protein lerEdw1_006503 [Lerista edwardsae]